MNKIISHNVRIMRIMRNVSQLEFAKKCKLSQSTIAQIENGKKCPSISTIVKLATALKVKPHQLLIKHEITEVKND